MIVFGMVVWVRLRLLGLPLQRDEGEYAYMAQQLLQGILPYTESQSMKFPGIYFVYAGILTFFGENPSAIHLSIIFVNLATAYFIFLLGKSLLNLSAGIVAAVCFSVLTLSPALQGVSANSEHFVLLPALAGIFFSAGDAGSASTTLSKRLIIRKFPTDKAACHVILSVWCFISGFSSFQ